MGIKQLPKRSGEYLFEIIMRRYETKPTIMTSNRPLEDWGKLLGDVSSVTAILDRFLHHTEIVTIHPVRLDSRRSCFPYADGFSSAFPPEPARSLSMIISCHWALLIRESVTVRTIPNMPD